MKLRRIIIDFDEQVLEQRTHRTSRYVVHSYNVGDIRTQFFVLIFGWLSRNVLGALFFDGNSWIAEHTSISINCVNIFLFNLLNAMSINYFWYICLQSVIAKSKKCQWDKLEKGRDFRDFFSVFSRTKHCPLSLHFSVLSSFCRIFIDELKRLWRKRRSERRRSKKKRSTQPETMYTSWNNKNPIAVSKQRTLLTAWVTFKLWSRHFDWSEARIKKKTNGKTALHGWPIRIQYMLLPWHVIRSFSCWLFVGRRHQQL